MQRLLDQLNSHDKTLCAEAMRTARTLTLMNCCNWLCWQTVFDIRDVSATVLFIIWF